MSDPTKCIKRVADFTGFHFNQCLRKRGHGPEGKYCKQHDPAAIAIRREARLKRQSEEFEAPFKAQEQRINEAFREGQEAMREAAALRVRKMGKPAMRWLLDMAAEVIRALPIKEKPDD